MTDNTGLAPRQASATRSPVLRRTATELEVARYREEHRAEWRFAGVLGALVAALAGWSFLVWVLRRFAESRLWP